MADNKNKKKVQQADAAQTASKAEAKKADAKKAAKSDAASKKKAKKAAKGEKPGMLARTKNYFGSVRSEMKRVTWPSKQELINYSVAVCVSLVVVGVAIALLDAAISQGLVLFSGLRG